MVYSGDGVQILSHGHSSGQQQPSDQAGAEQPLLGPRLQESSDQVSAGGSLMNELDEAEVRSVIVSVKTACFVMLVLFRVLGRWKL